MATNQESCDQIWLTCARSSAVQRPLSHQLHHPQPPGMCLHSETAGESGGQPEMLLLAAVSSGAREVEQAGSPARAASRCCMGLQRCS